MTAQSVKATPEIKEYSLNAIKECPDNFRKISDENFKGLQASLQNFGYIDLIVINKRTMEIVSGHQRFKALKAQGMKSATCIVVDMDKAKQRAAMITMNNKNIQGYWTDQINAVADKIKKEMPREFLDLKIKQMKSDISKEGTTRVTEFKSNKTDEKLIKFIAARANSKARSKDLSETHFWLCLTFQSYAQKIEFLEGCGLEPLYDCYIDGQEFAKKFKIKITPNKMPPLKFKMDKNLTEMAL